MASSKPARHQLVIDAGPQGAGRGGHSHADALSVQLTVGGEALLTDPGTFVYVDSTAERTRFRGTASHNTVKVDGLGQADPAGPFGGQGHPHPTVNRWGSRKAFAFFAARPAQYRRSHTPTHNHLR